MTAQDWFHEQLESVPTEYVVAVATTKTLLLPMDESRVSAIISAPVTNPMTLTFSQDAAVTTGLGVPGGGQPVLLSLAMHGSIVRGPIYATIAVAGETITVWAALNLCACAHPQG